MISMESILEYLKKTYRPSGIIAYGSFADGSANAHSDFDALVIADVPAPLHDGAVVGGTELDVFVYPTANFRGDYDREEYVQVFDGNILLDEDGSAAALKQSVLDYLDSFPAKTREENEKNVSWCEKMLLRAERGDAEGFFRWHWLLTDSLQIYCDLRSWRYFGPKKSLRRMRAEDAEGYQRYCAALAGLDYGALSAWIGYLRALMEKGGRKDAAARI